MGLTSLVSVTGTGNIVYIGNSSFSGCTALTTFNTTADTAGIVISSSVTEIGDNVFYGDTAITTISMPLNTVGSDIISGCSSLTSMTFTSGSETNVADDAFEGAGDGSTVVKVLNLSETSIGTSVSTSPGWKGMSVYTSDYSTYGTTLVEVTEPGLYGFENDGSGTFSREAVAGVVYDYTNFLCTYSESGTSYDAVDDLNVEIDSSVTWMTYDSSTGVFEIAAGDSDVSAGAMTAVMSSEEYGFSITLSVTPVSFGSDGLNGYVNTYADYEMSAFVGGSDHTVAASSSDSNITVAENSDGTIRVTSGSTSGSYTFTITTEEDDGDDDDGLTITQCSKSVTVTVYDVLNSNFTYTGGVYYRELVNEVTYLVSDAFPDSITSATPEASGDSYTVDTTGWVSVTDGDLTMAPTQAATSDEVSTITFVLTESDGTVHYGLSLALTAIEFSPTPSGNISIISGGTRTYGECLSGHPVTVSGDNASVGATDDGDYCITVTGTSGDFTITTDEPDAADGGNKSATCSVTAVDPDVPTGDDGFTDDGNYTYSRDVIEGSTYVLTGAFPDDVVIADPSYPSAWTTAEVADDGTLTFVPAADGEGADAQTISFTADGVTITFNLTVLDFLIDDVTILAGGSNTWSPAVEEHHYVTVDTSSTESGLSVMVYTSSTSYSNDEVEVSATATGSYEFGIKAPDSGVTSSSGATLSVTDYVKTATITVGEATIPTGTAASTSAAPPTPAASSREGRTP